MYKPNVKYIELSREPQSAALEYFPLLFAKHHPYWLLILYIIVNGNQFSQQGNTQCQPTVAARVLGTGGRRPAASILNLNQENIKKKFPIQIKIQPEI
jgi:hypothetical protein